MTRTLARRLAVLVALLVGSPLALAQVDLDVCTYGCPIGTDEGECDRAPNLGGAFVAVFDGGRPVAVDTTQDFGGRRPACASFQGVPVPSEVAPSPGFVVSAPYPNPGPGPFHVSVRTDRPGPVRAELYDVAGRLVTETEAAPAGGTADLRVGGDLATGVYALRVAQADRSQTTLVTRIEVGGGETVVGARAPAVVAVPAAPASLTGAATVRVMVGKGGFAPVDTTLDASQSQHFVELQPGVYCGGNGEGPEIFEVVEVAPKLIGGLEGLQSRVPYPQAARDAGIEGQVVVQFVVGIDGLVYDPVVVRSPSELLDTAALFGVVTSDFTPGQQRGRNVCARFALPLTFRLRP